MSLLFEPMTIGDITLRNRIWVSPMCQYSCFAQDGLPTDWHLVHLGGFAKGGFGLLMAEATAVAPEGRISPEDTGLWSEAHVVPWRRITDFVHSQGAKIGIQLAHAGRKGSSYGLLTTTGDDSVPASHGGWQTVSSTSRPFGRLAPARALTPEEIAGIPALFAQAALRAECAGFDVVEIHAAHGYLLHQFLSPAINDRTDDYGGSFAARTRLVREVVDAVRAVWPRPKPLFMRVSATDWVDGGWDVDETAELARELVSHGVDLVDVSSGGGVLEQRITVGPGYQVPFARKVLHVSGLPVAAVGLIEDPVHAERILLDGDADVVFLGRAALREPTWPLRAAAALGVPRQDAPYPPQYNRAPWRTWR